MSAGEDHGRVAAAAHRRASCLGDPADEAGSTCSRYPFRHRTLVVPLTPRRAQILAAVTSAGSAGISAAELSQRLYGDGDHVVTVRAEVSRLRRSVGALLATRPYRWAEGVDARVD